MNYPSLKKVTAAVSSLAIATTSVLSFGMTVTTAATAFTDAASIAPWAVDSVQALVDSGVLKGNPDGSFKPQGTLNRAELAQIAMKAAGLPEDTTGAPHFNDVKPTDWFYAAVETLYNAGVVSGINGGALTDGKATYNPAGTVNRAEAAKILVVAFDLEFAHMPNSPVFPDVAASDWFFDYVETAYAHGILNGYTDGRFGPSDAVTREQVAVVANNAVITKEDGSLVREGVVMGKASEATPTTPTTPETPTTPTTPGTPTASEGNLSVALSAKTPAASTIAKGATGITVASYDFTASSAGEVTVSAVKVARTGVGSRSDIDGVYLYDGDTKLTGSRSISSDTQLAEFSGVNFKVPAGSTKTLNIVIDLAYTAGGSNQHQFLIADAASITSNAKGVTGTFPVTGNVLTVGGSTVSTVLVATNGTVTSPTVGDKQVEVAKFQLTAGTNNMHLNRLTLTNTGNLSLSNLANFTLLQGTTDLKAVATTANDKVTFTLPTPYQQKNGIQRQFVVKADIIGGRNNDTIKFGFDDKGDIQAFDEVLNTNALPATSGTTFTSSTVADLSGSGSGVAIKAGDVNVVFSGPAAKTISKGAQDVKLWEGTISAGTAAQFKNTYIYLASTEPVATVSGLCSTATANITNIKVVRTDTSATLVGPVDYTCDTDAVSTSTNVTSATADTAMQVKFTDSWNLDAGQSIPVAITANVRNASDNDSNDITATFGTNGSTIWGSTDVKRNDAASSEYLTSFVPSTAIAGNRQTIAASSLTVSVASTPTSTTLVKGAQKQNLLGVNFQAGTNSDVKITSLKFVGDAGTLAADVDGTVAEAGGTDVRAANVIQTLYLMDGSTVLKTKSFNTSDDTITFDSLALTIPAGSTKTLTVTGDVSSSLSTTTYFALDLYTGTASSSSSLASNINSEDKDGNSISEVVGTKFKNITAAATASTLMTLSPTGGAIVATVDADTPSSAILLMNQTKKEVYRAKFTPSTEDFRIERLSFVNESSTNTFGANDNNVTKVYLEYPDSLTNSASTKTVEGTLSGGVVLFDITSAPMMLKKDQDARVKLYVDTSDSTSATSGAMVRFYMNLADFKAYGQGSQVQQTGASLRLSSTAGSVGSTAAATAYGVSGEAVSEFNGANADTTDTTLVVDGSTNYKIGDLIRNNDTGEQMIVTADLTSAGTLSVLRGANGTTATAIADNNDIDKLGQDTTVATAADVAGVTTSLTNVVASSAISRGDLVFLASDGIAALTSQATYVVTSNLAAGTGTLSVYTAAANSSKLTGVTNTTGPAAGTDDLVRVTTYRPVAGNFFSIAKSTASAALSASSPSGSKTTSAKDLILAATFTNGGSFASTIASSGDTSGVTVTTSGSLLTSSTGGVDSFTVSVYDNADLNDSNKVATITMTETGAATGLYTQSAIAFTKTVEIAANSSKTLYFTAPTNTSGVFTTTTSDDLLTAAISGYTWSDGVTTFTASDTGYGITLPLNGNTLRY